MFPKTPEGSQKPVRLIWSCPKSYLSVRMSQGYFGRHESVMWLFRLIRKCQLPLWVRSKVRAHEIALLSEENYMDILSLYRTFQETFSQYLGIKMRITQPPKIVVKLLENLSIFQTNGTVIQKFQCSFSQTLEISRQYCSLEQLFYRKKSLDALV